jgi:hypothetical protein
MTGLAIHTLRSSWQKYRTRLALSREKLIPDKARITALPGNTRAVHLYQDE